MVREQAICADLSTQEREALSRLGRHHHIGPGQTLMWEGDEALVVANVLEGVLKLTTSMGDGREQIVGIVYPSDFIGRPFGAQSNHSVTALTPAKLCSFPRVAFDEFARDHPGLEHRLLQRTLTELDRARHWMLLLGRKTASERIATFLLEMQTRLGQQACRYVAPAHTIAADAHHHGAPGSKMFTLPFGRQQMADILGLTIETVSRQLTRLRQQGIIDTPDRRTIVVCNHAALRRESGDAA